MVETETARDYYEKKMGVAHYGDPHFISIPTRAEKSLMPDASQFALIT